MGQDDVVPTRYLAERLRELTAALDRLDQKIDVTLGDHAVRLAKVELRLDAMDKKLDAATDTRWKALAAWTSGIAVLIALIAVMVTITTKGI